MRTGGALAVLSDLLPGDPLRLELGDVVLPLLADVLHEVDPVHQKGLAAPLLPLCTYHKDRTITNLFGLKIQS